MQKLSRIETADHLLGIINRKKHRGIEGYLLATFFVTLTSGCLLGMAVGKLPQAQVLTKFAKGPIFAARDYQNAFAVGCGVGAIGPLFLSVLFTMTQLIPIDHAAAERVRTWREKPIRQKASLLISNLLAGAGISLVTLSGCLLVQACASRLNVGRRALNQLIASSSGGLTTSMVLGLVPACVSRNQTL